MTKSAPRIIARVDEETQGLLIRAAALAGMPSVNAFVVSSAVEKAKKIIPEEERMRLTEEESRQFIEALQRPAQIHPRLAKAFEAYEVKNNAS